MRRFLGIAGVAFGLVVLPAVSYADPIGTNGCITADSGVSECDIYADYAVDAISELIPTFGDYLVGYTFLLNAGADLTTFEASDVAHILVIHSQLFQLISNTAVNGLFSGFFDAAVAGSAIDSVLPDAGQLAGCPPIPTGVPSYGGVGYCTTADVVTLAVNWGVGGEDPIGGLDVLRIHTALPVVEPPPPPPPTGVPEPGSLSLLALGGLSSFLLRRRKASVR